MEKVLNEKDMRGIGSGSGSGYGSGYGDGSVIKLIDSEGKLIEV